MEKIKRLPLWVFYGLLAYMPFHIFLSQWLSTFTGGLSAWKVGKDVITIIAVLICLSLVIYKKAYRHTPFMTFVVLSLFYTLLHVVLYFKNHGTSLDVAELATVYNSRLLWYLIIGMSVALLLPKELKPSRLVKCLLLISTLVVCLGLLQHALPKDTMTHFGYSLSRGARPAFFIDDKPDLPRIMSTIRDPNSLGAYLVLPILLLTLYLSDKRHRKQQQLVGGLLGLHLLALFLTFSRAAWLGTLIGVSILAAVRFRSQLTPWLTRQWPLVVGCFLLFGSLTLMFRNQYVVQNILIHSDESTKQIDSNGLHLELAERAARGSINRPIGHGPGTAGIVSIQNSGGGILTENYFIQIGYEVGLLGLFLFLIIISYTQITLTKIISNNLVVALWATWWSYLFIGLVSHLWTNEAVAAQWWLLTGAVIGLNSLPKKQPKKV